jgi:hypothetical protein
MELNNQPRLRLRQKTKKKMETKHAMAVRLWG